MTLKLPPQTALKYVMEAEKNGASYVTKTVAVVDDAAILAMTGIAVTAICMSDPNCRQGVTDTLKSIGQFATDAARNTVDKTIGSVKGVANWLKNDDGGDKTNDSAEKDKIKQSIAGKSGGTANLDPDDGDDSKKKQQQTDAEHSNKATVGEDTNQQKIEFFENDAQIKHIFRNDEGHVLDTPENRQKILDTVNDEKNFVKTDALGMKHYSKILEDGREVWVRVWKNSIRNAGINDIPIKYKKVKNNE
ncbi:hypothetical protein MIDIC_150002 [Alphaproteobacteria bacterium]